MSIGYQSFERSDHVATSTIKVTFPVSVEKVWNIVTSLDHFSWRSDLKDIKVIDEHTFVECTKDGYETTFTITKTQPLKRWEFDIENDKMKGHWIGVFSQQGTQTTIEFTEDVTTHIFFMKPFVTFYLKKQQAAYVKDLKKELEKISEYA